MTSTATPVATLDGPRHGLGFKEFVAIVAALMALNALAIDVMLPALGDSKPAISRRSVVLPHPEGPSRVKNSPRLIVTETRSSATTAPAP